MNKKLTLGILLSILSLGFTGCKSSNNYNEEINDAYNNLLNQEKESEYVKITYKDGLYIENYRNNLSSIERTDRYDKNGKLEYRGIIDNKNRLLTSVFKDEDNKWIGYKEGISDSIIKENAKAFETSAINTICEDELVSMLDNDYKFREKANNQIKYTDDENNSIYINQETNMISKIEFCETDNIIIDGESVASYEFEILEKLSESDMSISTKNNNNIDLSKIKLEDRGKQEGMDGPSFG